MKVLFVIGGLIATVAIAATAIGAMLPKAHTASRSVAINRTPADLFAHIRKRTASEKEYVLVSEEAPRRIVTRVVDGMPYGGTWTIDLEPDGSGTRVTVVERGEVYNPLFRFLSRFVFGHTATIDRYLKELAAPSS